MNGDRVEGAASTIFEAQLVTCEDGSQVVRARLSQEVAVVRKEDSDGNKEHVSLTWNRALGLLANKLSEATAALAQGVSQRFKKVGNHEESEDFRITMCDFEETNRKYEELVQESLNLGMEDAQRTAGLQAPISDLASKLVAISGALPGGAAR